MSEFVPKVVGELPKSRQAYRKGITESVAAVLRANRGQWVQLAQHPKATFPKGGASARWKRLKPLGVKFAQRTVGDFVNVYAMLPAEDPPAQG